LRKKPGAWKEKHVPCTATRPFAEAGDFAAAVDEESRAACEIRRKAELPFTP